MARVLWKDTGYCIDEVRWLLGYKHSTETVSAFRATTLGILMKTPSSGGDMEIQKAMLFYYAVTSTVCLCHS